MCVHVLKYVYMCTCVFICIDVCMYVCVLVRVHTHTHTFVYAFVFLRFRKGFLSVQLSFPSVLFSASS